MTNQTNKPDRQTPTNKQKAFFQMSNHLASYKKKG